MRRLRRAANSHIPRPGGSILPGVTRRSVIRILKDWDYNINERNISIGVIALASAFEATFFGTVVDSTSGQPIPGVAIGIAGKMQSVTTNDSGYFEIPNVQSGTHEVTARRLVDFCGDLFEPGGVPTH